MQQLAMGGTNRWAWETLGNYRLVSLPSVPVKVKEQIVLKAISKHTEDKKVIRSSQHGITESQNVQGWKGPLGII